MDSQPVIPAQFHEDFRLAEEGTIRHQRRGGQGALDATIAAWCRILMNPTFCEAGEWFQMAVLYEAGSMYHRRYRDRNTGHAKRPDLDTSIGLLQGAVDTAPRDAPDLPMVLYSLGAILHERYALLGQLVDLQGAMQFLEQAVSATAAGEPVSAGYRHTLGAALRDRYARDGDLADLEAAIKVSKKAVDITAPNAPERARFLNGLGAALRDRHSLLGHLKDLQDAIDAHQQAVAASGPDAPNRAMFLSNLGNALRDRYARDGELADLQAAIKECQKAVAIAEPEAPDRAMFLSNLGIGLLDRYARLGQAEDLQNAIEFFKQAVESTSPHAPLRASYLNYRGIGLRFRYNRSGKLNDLEDAIKFFDQAVKTSRPDAPRRARYYNNLGNALHSRYARRGKLADLQTAIKAHQQAVDKTRPGDPFCATHLTNLGNDLSARYARSGQPKDLQAAIKAYQQAVALASSNAPDRAVFLSNLGTGLGVRYKRDDNLADLQSAIEHHKEARAITPDDSPRLAGYLTNLGKALRERYACGGQLADLQDARSAYRGACELGLETALEVALTSAHGWGNWALERRDWQEAAEAYDYGAKAIEGLVEGQVLRPAKETWLRDAQGVAANAAYALARTGALERAVEVIETGRARLLAEALERNRRDLEQLPELGHDTLLARYRRATAHWAALTAEVVARPSETTLPAVSDLRGALAAARSELDDVVDAVRQVPGYENFLRAPTFAQIRAAARDMPLAYVMATAAGGLVLIVPAAGENSDVSSASGVQAVWLDELTRAAVRELVLGPDDTLELGGYLGAYARWRNEPSNNETGTQWFDALDAATSWLWDKLMGRLITSLVPSGPPNPSSPPPVVLVPSGLLGLLPLHVAWTEDEAARNGRRYALDVAAFRYAPNARALMAAQTVAEKKTTGRLLLCVEPQPVSANPLPDAEKEAKDILQYWPRGSYTDRWHATATHEELVTQLPRHTYLHFAGHAFAGWAEPQLGGLLMASDQVLTVRELTGMHLPVRLAVLSACESGVPGTRLPDEVIGLPTALMEAGVAGVVASFWSVADGSTAQLMADFHRLWRSRPSDTSSQKEEDSEAQLTPPEALRRAQIQLRDEGGFYAHPFYWGAFAYTGL